MGSGHVEGAAVKGCEALHRAPDGEEEGTEASISRIDVPFY